jgi:GNAT superfamily N-acetyltransferase
MKDVQIRKLKDSDRNSILYISRCVFGDGYYEPAGSGNNQQTTLVGEVAGEIAGFCSGYILKRNEILSFARTSRAELSDDLRYADQRGTIGVIKTIGVQEKFQGYGVGTRLFEQAEKHLAEQGAESVVVPAWEKTGSCSLKSILERHSYRMWKQEPEFWKEECENKKFRCIACSDSCVCSAIFWRKSLV